MTAPGPAHHGSDRQTRTPVPAILGHFRLSEPPPRLSRATLARRWRGAALAALPDDPALHGHGADGPIYRYPPIHFRWDDLGPVVFALPEAARVVLNHTWAAGPIHLGDPAQAAAAVRIVDVRWEAVPLLVEPIDRLLRYRFRSPWLALNQENHRRYDRMTPAQKRAELDRVLVGNLLSAFSGVGYRIPQDIRLFAAAESPRAIACRYKDVDLEGFLTTIVTNFVLPRGIAIGRAVSHGYGWLEPLGDTPPTAGVGRLEAG